MKAMNSLKLNVWPLRAVIGGGMRNVGLMWVRINVGNSGRYILSKVQVVQ